MQTGLRVATVDDWEWLQVRLLRFRGHVVKPGSSQLSQIYQSSKVHLRPCLLLPPARLTRGWGWGCDGHGCHCWLWHAGSRANHLCVCVCESELVIVVPLLTQWSLSCPWMSPEDGRGSGKLLHDMVLTTYLSVCLWVLFLFSFFGLFIYFLLLLFCFG